MKSNIFDKNGKEVQVGDELAFPYIDPMGNMHNEIDFEAVVRFKHGCFGYDDGIKFVPLMEWMITERGKYISNRGCELIYTEKYPFEILQSNL